jgi:hypothetical protein
MPDGSAGTPDVTSRFFSNYLKCLAKSEVKGKYRQYYVKHIEWFIKEQADHTINTLCANDSTVTLKR